MRGIALSGKVRFLDTTLRDGEQTPGVSLDMDEKLAIARSLDALGVQVIEAGSAITSEGERKSMKAVADSGLNAEICSFVRTLKSDVDLALQCDVDSIHQVVPLHGRRHSVGHADGSVKKQIPVECKNRN